jgi:hypothetical protein
MICDTTQDNLGNHRDDDLLLLPGGSIVPAC